MLPGPEDFPLRRCHDQPCDRPASFGTGVFLLRDPPELGTWRCLDHDRAHHARASQTPAHVPKRRAIGKTEGNLL